jgi:hypothetical protein
LVEQRTFNPLVRSSSLLGPTIQFIMNEEINQLLRDFFEILERQEESESGCLFHPTVISSCRIMDTKRLDEILTALRRQVKI